MSWPFRVLKSFADVVVTAVLWIYFVCAGVLLFLPVCAGAYVLSGRREVRFQKIAHTFYRGFFWVARNLVPGLKITIPEEIRQIRSAVIICNHISYLDPILLISLWPKHRTFVKSELFRIPVFGWVQRHAGYIPAGAEGRLSQLLLERIDQLDSFLQAGGNLFIFPEGSRSTDGTLGRFEPGAFKLARRFNVPVTVLYIRNTNRLFTPGRFLFNTCVRNEISVERLCSVEIDHDASERARRAILDRMIADGMPGTSAESV